MIHHSKVKTQKVSKRHRSLEVCAAFCSGQLVDSRTGNRMMSSLGIPDLPDALFNSRNSVSILSP